MNDDAVPEIVGLQLGQDGKQVYLLRYGNWSGERSYADFLRLSHARKPRRLEIDAPLQLGEEGSTLLGPGLLNAEPSKTSGLVARIPEQQQQQQQQQHDTLRPRPTAQQPKCVQEQGLPKKSLGALAKAAPWEKDGEGWRPELKGSCAKVQRWLQAGLSPHLTATTSSSPTHVFLSRDVSRPSSKTHGDSTSSSSCSRRSSNNTAGTSMDSPVSLPLAGSSSSPLLVRRGSSELVEEVAAKKEKEEGELAMVARDLQQYFVVSANLNALLKAAFKSRGLLDGEVGDEEGGYEEEEEEEDDHCSRRDARGGGDDLGEGIADSNSECKEGAAETVVRRSAKKRPRPTAEDQLTMSASFSPSPSSPPSYLDMPFLPRHRRRFVVVEPSCGDGRMLKGVYDRVAAAAAAAVLADTATAAAAAASAAAVSASASASQVVAASLAEAPSQAGGVELLVSACVGVELDGAMAKQAAASKALTPPLPSSLLQPSSSFSSSSSSSSSSKVPVLCRDFLQTTGHHLALALLSHDNDWGDAGGEGRDADGDRADGDGAYGGDGDGGDASSSSKPAKLSKHENNLRREVSPLWPPFDRTNDDDDDDEGGDNGEVNGEDVGDNRAANDNVDGEEEGGSLHKMKRKRRRRKQRLEVLVIGSPPFTDYCDPLQQQLASVSPSTSSSPLSSLPCTSSSSSTRGSSAVATSASASSESSSSSSSASWFRSLPLRFVLHSALPPSQGGLGARRVAFLLPKRCTKPSFEAAVRAGLNYSPTSAHGWPSSSSSSSHSDSHRAQTAPCPTASAAATTSSSEAEERAASGGGGAAGAGAAPTGGGGGAAAAASCASSGAAAAVNGAEQHAPRNRCLGNNGGGGGGGVSWEVKFFPAPDKRFFFRGKLVPQPSVVWVLTRRGSWAEEEEWKERR